MTAIVQGFRRLADFRGRDSRSRFWPFALVVLLTLFVLMGGGMAAVMGPIFSQASAYAVQHPEAATVVSGPGYYSVEIHDPNAIDMSGLGAFFWLFRGTILVAVVLLAAAVTRRLHDTNRAGWWGLPPVVFLCVAAVLFPAVMQQFMASEDAPLGPFFLLFANNVLYMASLAALVIMLLLDGTKTANRYGPPSPDQPASLT